MKPEYALIGISVVLLVGTIFVGGLSVWMTDLATSIPLLHYATYMFVIAIILLIFAEMAHIFKSHFRKT